MKLARPCRLAPFAATLLLIACAAPPPSATSGGMNEAGVDGAGPEGGPGPDGDTGTVAFQFLDVSAGGKAVTEALYGDVLDVRLTGLPAGRAVTIHARNLGSDGQGYEAYASFAAGPDGTVDAASTAPSMGTYEGVDPDGLVWSGQPKPEPTDQKAWGTNPLTLYFSAEVDGTTVASAALPRFTLASGITKVSVTADGLVGVFYAPAGGGMHGAVIAFGGSEGGLASGQFLAEYFASLGHPALGLAYFGAAGLPQTLSGVPLEYFQKAHDWLVSQAGVTQGKVAVVGGSRGGELALLLGATFPWVTAVVAQCPSGVRWGDDVYGAPTWNTAAWTYGGQPLPFIPFTNGVPVPVTLANGSIATSVLPVYAKALSDASPEQIAAATTKVEATAGPILMQAAADDQMWGSCPLSQIAMDRLTQSGHAAAHGDQLTCYPGAGHNIFDVGAPTASILSIVDGGEALALGGNPADVARAERDADTKVRAFLASNLP
jgi:dienelactone hydrolase